ncbi:aminopeptidase-like protein [Mesorhizobium sp. RMAD-H1]|nr:aminopeptidase-like protein [Mesorhizobium sp. RMAD-H1]
MNKQVGGAMFENAGDDEIGKEIHAIARRLYPICRSITGDGVRETLAILAEHIALERHEVATGTPLFDWTAPQEWIIRDAYIADASGRRVVDFRKHNLHVLNYSRPIRARMAFAELKRHIHTIPEQPELIPYRTSYYAENWGFCMTHNAFLAMEDGEYEVMIDAEHRDGSLTYGEYLHAGASEETFLLSAHICHPSLANDNCSGLALLTLLARNLGRRATRYSYRFLFAPGTVGSLAWLSRNEERVPEIMHGLVVSCVGDGGGPTYKRSRRGSAFIDRAMAHVLEHFGGDATILDFSPYGYDERQFCSPGFNLPVGLFQRSAFGTFPEYHTSADNLDFIRPEHLAASYRIITDVINIVEGDWRPVSTNPKGEPQLGRRGLYSAFGGDKAGAQAAMAMLWALNLADGDHSLLAMAERSGLRFADIAQAADLLRRHDLLRAAG